MIGKISAGGGKSVSCVNCGGDELISRPVSGTFVVSNRSYFCSGIPAEVCPNCLEEYFEPDIVEEIRKAIDDLGESESQKQVSWISYAA
jgi:YgiT-type zinc finger domain-containing protein